MEAAQFMGERRQRLAVVTIFAPHWSSRQPHLKSTPVKSLHHLCSEPIVLNVSLIWVGVVVARSENPQKEWTMIAAANLVVGIAEPKRTEFNLQGCREVPSKITERRREGADSTLPDWFLTIVGLTLTENTADFPFGHLHHVANFYSGNLSISTQTFRISLPIQQTGVARAPMQFPLLGNYFTPPHNL